MVMSGRLRDRCAFERQGETDDGYGNTLDVWSPLITVWGDLRERTGREPVEAGALEDVRTADLRVRQSSETAAISSADRVIIRGAQWDILSIIQPDRRGAMLLLRLKSRVHGDQVLPPPAALGSIPDLALALDVDMAAVDVSGYFTTPSAGQVWSYSAAGLPDGVVISTAGVISGRPTRATPAAAATVTAAGTGGATADQTINAVVALASLPNLIPAPDAAFDQLGGWSALGTWSVAAGEAAKTATAGQENLEYDLTIPSGDVLVGYKMRSSNQTGGVIMQFGGGFLDFPGQRREIGPHAYLGASAGHIRLRLAAQSSWAGAIDDVEFYDMNAVQSLPADIIICGGQSNAEAAAALGVDLGRDVLAPFLSYLAGVDVQEYGADSAALVPAVDPLQHVTATNRGVGPAAAFGRRLLEYIPAGRRVVLVTAAKAGTALTGAGAAWDPAGPGASYTQMIAQAQAALALCPAGSRIAGMIWSQGESDNGVNVGATYPPAFAALHAQMLVDLSLSALPVAILGPTPEGDTAGRLATAQATLDEFSGDVNALEGVRYSAGPAGYAIPGDDVHFTASGNVLRGQQGADLLAPLIWP